MRYVALLRGINVGGKNVIKMAELRVQLESIGLNNVRTYIQSGNILFTSDLKDSTTLATLLERVIADQFGLHVPAVVLSQSSLEGIAANVPSYWMKDHAFKYNFIFLKPPYDLEMVLSEIGELKPGIETITPGDGVLYQSMSIQLFGRTTTGKLATKPIYKQMTIRNHNTITKLVTLLQEP